MNLSIDNEGTVLQSEERLWIDLYIEGETTSLFSVLFFIHYNYKFH